MNYYDAETRQRDKNALDTFKKLLGLEHFGWKLGAIMVLISMIIFVVVSIIFIIIGSAYISSGSYTDPPGEMFIAMGITYLVVSLTVLLPLMIICFSMIKKVEYYQSTVDRDISIARTRCTSVGMLVFCVIFNTLAAIFFIINFAKTKNNAGSFDRIAAAQRGTY